MNVHAFIAASYRIERLFRKVIHRKFASLTHHIRPPLCFALATFFNPEYLCVEKFADYVNLGHFIESQSVCLRSDLESSFLE
jgi:hypothetical protein